MKISRTGILAAVLAAMVLITSAVAIPGCDRNRGDGPDDGGKTGTAETKYDDFTLKEKNGAFTCRTGYGLEYGVEGFTEVKDGMFKTESETRITFSSVNFGYGFNRVTFGYRCSGPFEIDVVFKDAKGAESKDSFFLEASSDGSFSALVEGFLDGAAFDGIVSVTAKPLVEKRNLFLLKSATTETVEIPATDGFGNYYVENDYLKLGIRLAWGGGISYIYDKKCTVPGLANLINQHDTGRLVQQSYYGTPKIEGVYDPGDFNGSAWNYNPVQGGDKYGTASRLIDFACEEGSVYVKTQAKDWGQNGFLTPSYMENKYTLDGKVINTFNRFVDFSCFTHPFFLQELPAFYTVSYLDTFVYYYGKNPWTDDALMIKPNLPDWTNAADARENVFQLPKSDTETWAAWVNTDDNYGIGLYTPNIDIFHAGRYKYDKSKSSESDSTNYFAPRSEIRLVSFEPIEYSYLITTGTVEEIRSTFKERKDFSYNALLSLNKPGAGSDELYDFTFIDFSVEGTEAIFGDLHNTTVEYSEEEHAAKLTVTEAYDVYTALSLVNNSADELNAEDFDTVEIEYMLPKTNALARYTPELFLVCGEYASPLAGYSVTSSLKRDGQYHTVSFPVASNECWTGTINAFRFDYFNDCAAGDVIYVKSFALKKSAVAAEPGVFLFDSEAGTDLIAFVKDADVDYDAEQKAAKLTVAGADVNILLLLGGQGAALNAEDYSKIVVEYMIPKTNKHKSYRFEMYFCTGDVTEPTEDNVARDNYVFDGEYHTLEVPMSAFATHSGEMHNLRYDFFSVAEAGDVIYLKSVTFVKK